MINPMTRSLRRVCRGPILKVVRKMKLNEAYWQVLLRTTPPIHQYELANTSVKMHLLNKNEIRQFSGGFTERLVLKNFISDLKRTDTVFDVGANMGVYSLFAAKRGVDCVHAFEPHSTVGCRLQMNSDINSVDINHHSIALSDTTGTSSFSMPDDGLSPLKGRIEATGDFIVNNKRADEFITDTNKCPDVVKIDVEGHEAEVLKGFGEMIDKIRTIYIETHGETEQQIYKLLNDFDVSVIDERHNQKFLRASQS